VPEGEYMPDTEKREEGKGLPKGPSGMPASGTDKDWGQAAQGSPPSSAMEPPAAAGGTGSSGEATVSAPDMTGGQSIGEFADSVVSGLEQANLVGEEKQSVDLHGLDLEHMTEAFFAGWGDADGETSDGDPYAHGQHLNARSLSEMSLASMGSGKRDSNARSGQEPSGGGDLSQMSMASWGAPEDGERNSKSHGQPEARGFSSVSDVSLASWGASEGVGSEESIPEVEPEEAPQPRYSGAQTLAGLGLPSGSGFPDYAAPSGADLSKHDELADAVESALRSVYGEQPAKPAAKPFQKPAIAEEKAAPSLVWNRSSSPANDDLTPQEVIFNYFDYNPEDEDRKSGAAAEPENDGLTPQEVILNYFDYPSSTQNGNGYPHAARSPSGREREEPITLRSSQEPVVPLRRAPPPEERPVHREEWPVQAPQPQQYSGPPSFPVPGPALPQRPAAHVAAQESSRLLGAAAIGLMGGIAIAASLAAFLIYGPHPAAVEIPGIGNLRLDRDEQGYGRTLQEEAAREPARSRARAPVEMSSEILASDAVAVPGQPTSLAISIRSAQSFEKMLVSIAGIPEGGRLSAGVDTGGGNWLIAPRRLNGLTINLPAGAPDVVSLEAQLLDSNTRMPLSARGTFAVRVMQSGGSAASAALSQTVSPPAPAPAYPARQPQQSAANYPFTTQILSQPTAPAAAANVQRAAPAPAPAPDLGFRYQTEAPPPPPQRQAALAPQTVISPPPPAFTSSIPRRAAPRPEVEDLIREGNKRMREGDIIEARQFYQRAVAFGDAEAALAMGRSYDPIYFARIEKKNSDPDAAKAFDWYKRAMDAGASQTAMVRIENLKHFLNE
jgi:hypothetical protein